MSERFTLTMLVRGRFKPGVTNSRDSAPRHPEMVERGRGSPTWVGGACSDGGLGSVKDTQPHIAVEGLSVAFPRGLLLSSRGTLFANTD